MKHSTTLILLVQLVLCYSCHNYSDEQTLSTDVYNYSIRRAAVRGDAWSRTPEAISKHLFPARTQGEGNRSYAVQIDNKSNTSCVVSVEDEGAVEGEMRGQRWNASFEQKGNGWQLTKLTRSVKQ
jgi:hypothetical protein